MMIDGWWMIDEVSVKQSFVWFGRDKKQKTDLVETIRIFGGDGGRKRGSWKDTGQGSQRFILPDIHREFLEGEGFLRLWM